MLFLDPRIVSIRLGWRLGFGIGAMPGLIIIFFRNSTIPEESPLAHDARKEEKPRRSWRRSNGRSNQNQV